MVALKAPSDVDALRQQGLPRERVGEHAKLRRLCKVGKVIQLSHLSLAGGIQNKNEFLSCALSPCRLTAPPPLPEGGFRVPTPNKNQYL